MSGWSDTWKRPLYTFIDEGGDFNFSPTGSKYFTLTAVTCIRPFPLDDALGELRFDILEQGTPLTHFHASTDKQATRDQVFRLIRRELRRFRVDSVIVEKRKTGPALQSFELLYPRMLGYLLRYIVKGVDWSEHSELIVITDVLPEKKKRRAVEKAIKTTLSRNLGSRYRLYHHESKSCYTLQVADYFNWAIERKWARLDYRSYNLIYRAIRSEFDIFRSGTRYYYQ